MIVIFLKFNDWFLFMFLRNLGVMPMNISKLMPGMGRDNTERLRKLTENYVVSNAKIKAALGIDKLPVTAKEGLMKTIRSFEETK